MAVSRQMSKEEIIEVVEKALVDCDQNNLEIILVNFVDDEIDWNAIATIAVDAIPGL